MKSWDKKYEELKTSQNIQLNYLINQHYTFYLEI